MCAVTRLKGRPCFVACDRRRFLMRRSGIDHATKSTGDALERCQPVGVPWSISRASLAALAIPLCLGMAGSLVTAPDAAAQELRPNCANFLDREDSQIAYNADPMDPFGLDERGVGNGETCEVPEGDFGSQPPSPIARTCVTTRTSPVRSTSTHSASTVPTHTTSPRASSR